MSKKGQVPHSEDTGFAAFPENIRFLVSKERDAGAQESQIGFCFLVQTQPTGYFASDLIGFGIPGEEVTETLRILSKEHLFGHSGQTIAS